MSGAASTLRARAAHRLRRAGVALALALAPLAGGARAGDLTLQADVTGEQDSTPVSDAEFLRQSYWLQYRRAVTAPLFYWLSLRYQDDRGRTASPGTSSDLATGTLTPTVDLTYRQDAGGLDLKYELTRVHQRVTQPFAVTVSRDVQRFATRAWWKPTNLLETSLYADRTAYSERATNVDATDDRAGAAARYGRNDLLVTGEARFSRFSDAAGDTSRTAYGPRLQVAYSAPAGSRVWLGARYGFDYERAEQQTFGASGGTVEVRMDPVAGLYVLTDLPLDTSANPMRQEPALVDGALGTSTGVSLGPDGASFHNLGVDLGRVVELDQAVVHVRDAAGVAVPLSAPIRWSAYVSEDGVRWGQVDGAAGSFNPARSAYEIFFPATATRYLKVVNFGVNTVDTLVTELQVFQRQATGASQSLVSTRNLHSVAFTALAKLPNLVLSYSGQGNLVGRSDHGDPSRWSNDQTHLAGATAGPFGPVTFDLSELFTAAYFSGGAGQTSSRTTAAMRYVPLSRLESRLSVFQSRNRFASVTAVSNGADVSGTARIFDTLSVNAAIAASRQDVVAGGTTDSFLVSSGVTAELYWWLQLTGATSVQRVRSSGDVSAQVANPLLRVIGYERYSVEALLHPSDTLVLDLTAGYVATDTGEGPIRSVRADWTPFRDGMLLVRLDYTQDVDPFTGDSIQRYTVNPQLRFNRYCSLHYYYSAQRGRAGAAPIDSTNMYLRFSAYF